MPPASDCRGPSLPDPKLHPLLKLLQSNQGNINGIQDAAITAMLTEIP